MKASALQALPSLRLIALLLSMVSCAVYADAYSDVTQLVRVGKLKEALSRADQHLATQAKDPQMLFLKGVVLRDSGKTNEAIVVFTKLTQDYPELPEPYNNLAVLYAGQGQYDKARAALEAAIRTNPSYATAHNNLGDIYAKLASQAYNKALQLDSSTQLDPPKLALIREIFSSNVSKGQQLAGTPNVVATAPAPAPAPVPAKPAPAPAPATAAAPAKPVASSVTSTAAPIAIPSIAPAKPASAVAQASAPAAPSTKSAAASTLDSNHVQEIESVVAKWAKAWSARDVKTYLSMYGKDFDPPGAMSRKAWEEERRQRIANKSSISVKVEGLSVRLNGNHAIATFRQDYRAGGLAVSSKKTLDLAKAGETWQIVKETVNN